MTKIVSVITVAVLFALGVVLAGGLISLGAAALGFPVSLSDGVLVALAVHATGVCFNASLAVQRKR